MPIALLGTLALLRVVDASLPVTIGGLQVMVLVVSGLRWAGGARSGARADERLTTAVSTAVWRAVDVAVIDGTLNGVGLVVRGWSATLRRAQSGSVRVYALSMLAGVVAMLGYVLWR